MNQILQEILQYKAEEIRNARQAVPEQLLLQQIAAQNERNHAPKRSLKQNLQQACHRGVISEFKRKSPSKGWICREAQPDTVIPQYEQAGACGISVLTDQHFFGGSAADLQQARRITSLPLLRKDFILDPYQIAEAKYWGADVVLLIAAALSTAQCQELTACAHELGLEVLLEIHREEELSFIRKDTDIVGINNRDLNTFVTDIRTSLTLGKLLPQNQIRISESGISGRQSLRQLQKAGFHGFLIGEHLMNTPAPGETLKQLLDEDDHERPED